MTEIAPKKHWFQRNWKWFIPLGCLGSLILFLAFVACIMAFTFGLMKSSGAYKDALDRAKYHELVQELMGPPIEAGWYVTGNVNISGPSGQASISIPLSGTRDRGTIFVEATKSAGEWHYSTLVVEIRSSGRRINLLE